MKSVLQKYSKKVMQIYNLHCEPGSGKCTSVKQSPVPRKKAVPYRLHDGTHWIPVGAIMSLPYFTANLVTDPFLFGIQSGFTFSGSLYLLIPQTVRHTHFKPSGVTAPTSVDDQSAIIAKAFPYLGAKYIVYTYV